MGAAGNGGGYVPQDPSGRDEPDPATGNRMQTDYAQQLSVKENRRSAFMNGSGR
jgi:hypothetical protein